MPAGHRVADEAVSAGGSPTATVTTADPFRGCGTTITPVNADDAQGTIPNCRRCGHESSYEAKPFAVWRAAPPGLWPLLGLVNLFVALVVPKRPSCSWCHASLKPKAQARLEYDPFLDSTQHTPVQMMIRRQATAKPTPDGTGRWSSDAMRAIHRYLRWRDDGLCGLCAVPLGDSGINIEHVVPKKFGIFDITRGRAVHGTKYTSALHHMNNLQLAHDYCNRAKGNTPDPAKWRHPILSSLPTAMSKGSPRHYLWTPSPQQPPTPPRDI